MGDEDCSKELFRADHAFDEGMDKALGEHKKKDLTHRKTRREADAVMRRKGLAFLDSGELKDGWKGSSQLT